MFDLSSRNKRKRPSYKSWNAREQKASMNVAVKAVLARMVPAKADACVYSNIVIPW